MGAVLQRLIAMTSNSSAIHLRPRRSKGPLVASFNPSSRCYTAVALKASGSGELAVGSSLRRKQSKAKRQQEQAKEFDSSKVNSPFLDSRIVERKLRRASGT